MSKAEQRSLVARFCVTIRLMRGGPSNRLAPIGAGGMGEVYRARDATLKRDVALKVLPEAFASDAERLARFQREAELLAWLNHPNIAHIYSVEGRALVMGWPRANRPKGRCCLRMPGRLHRRLPMPWNTRTTVA